MAMSEIKAIRTSLGGTVNDVILTVVTATLRRYSELHGTKVAGRQIRIIVPVNVRGNGDVRELGNRITFLPVNVPLDVHDPRRLLRRVSERISFLRGVGVPEMVGLFGTLVSKVPLPLQAALVPLLTQLPLSLCNTICTNVPGPQLPLYLLGRRLRRCYPYVPIGGELGLNVAILSYDGVAYFGFGGDVHAVPDIDEFEGLLRESIEELRTAAAACQSDEQNAASATHRPAPASPTKSKKPRAAKSPAKPKAEAPSPPQPGATKRRPVPRMIPVRIAPVAQAIAAVSMPEAVTAQAGD